MTTHSVVENFNPFLDRRSGLKAATEPAMAAASLSAGQPKGTSTISPLARWTLSSPLDPTGLTSTSGRGQLGPVLQPVAPKSKARHTDTCLCRDLCVCTPVPFLLG